MNKSCVMKFNGGLGSILCSKCSVIIKTGKDFTELELKAFRGEANLEAQLCNSCKSNIRQEQIDSVIN